MLAALVIVNTGLDVGFDMLRVKLSDIRVLIPAYSHLSLGEESLSVMSLKPFLPDELINFDVLFVF